MTHNKNPNNLHKILARVVVAHKDKVLFVRRSQTDSRAGVWEMPGGSVDVGENLEEAARREVFEETGIQLSSLTFVHSSAYKASGFDRVSVLFRSELDHDVGVKLSHEHDEWKWCDKSNFNNLKLDHYAYSFFEDYFKQFEGVANVDKKSTGLVVNAYSDGGSRGNPGPSATGYVVYAQDETILAEGGEYLGITTNNQAEYQAVKKGLEVCIELGVSEVTFHVDSLLVVNQMSGAFKIKNRDLWPIHETIKSLVGEFKRVEFVHVPREKNKFADAKVNEVLDSRVA